MFRDGNFYVEYQINPANENHFLVLAGKNGARVYRKDLNQKNPTVFYRDGKYYNFLSTPKNPNESTDKRMVNRVLILPEEEIYSPALDPYEYWVFVRKVLALPKELAIFYWDDPYRNKNFDWGNAPVYESSSTKKIDQTTYECDRYVSEIKNLTGKVIAREIYNAFYENGKLVMVQKHFVRSGVEDSIISTIKIKTLTAEVPESAFTINEKVKIYKAHNGDLNDLLKNYEEVGEIGGEQK